MDEEDVTFRPDEAEIRADEKECPLCHYVHYLRIKCPECFPLTTEQYSVLLGSGTK